MNSTLSFRFADEGLNRRLIARLKKSEAKHFVDQDGTIHYSMEDEEFVENELIGSIRNEAFRPWQVLSCPSEWAERYKGYMTQHEIPFQEEIANSQVCFLLPRQYRPSTWKLDARRRVLLRA